jgi:aspartate/methionine/tyrosine aminotransferase
MRISERAERIEPFWVMEVAKAASQKAREVASTDRPVVFLNIGEPDFTAPPRVQAAAQAVVASGQTQYTPALGLDALRQAISVWYTQRFGVQVPAGCIAIGVFGTHRPGR